MNTNYSKQEHGTVEHYLHDVCCEAERMRIFRQMCYEAQMFGTRNSFTVEAKRVFDKMGYKA